MPEYRRRTILDLPPISFECPFCYKAYKTKHTVSAHIPTCTDNNEAPDETFDNIILTEMGTLGLYTVNDYLNERDKVIKTMKKYILTNELDTLTNQTGEQIRQYISDELAIEYDTLMYTWEIYMFFFIITDEERHLANEQQINNLVKMYDFCYKN